MNFLRSLPGAVFTIVSLLLVPAQAAEHRPPPRYTVRDLGTFPGGNVMVVRDINNRGQIVGGGTKEGDSDRFYPALYQNGRWHDLGSLPGCHWSTCWRINDRGQMIGFQNTDGFHTPLQFARGKVIDLSGIIGSNALVLGINNHGVMVGSSRRPGIFYQTAFVFKDGILTHLDALARDSGIGLDDINDSGDAVGSSWTTNTGGAFHAVLFSRGEMRDLGTVPGWTHSRALRINRRGHIVGYCSTANTEFMCAFLHRDGAMQDIGTLPGGTDVWTRAFAINNQDHIVGDCTHIEEIDGQTIYTQRPFLYIEGQMWDLNTLIPRRSGWKLLQATGINDRGQIIAMGQFKGKAYDRACLLTPIKPYRHQRSFDKKDAGKPAAERKEPESEQMDIEHLLAK